MNSMFEYLNFNGNISNWNVEKCRIYAQNV